MSSLKKFGSLILLTCALSAVSVSNAVASTFTASAEGSIGGWATSTQEFRFGGNTRIQCSAAEPSGTIKAKMSEELHVTVQHTSCSAVGIITHVSPITYVFTSSGFVHIKNTVTFTVTKSLFTGHCTITVPPQTRLLGMYSNLENDLIVDLSLLGLSYTSTGGFCGSSGESGAIETELRLWRNPGGSLSYDK